MKTIEQEWLAFEMAVVPKEAGPVQRFEMKKAFYSGAYAVLTQMRIVANQTNEDVAVTMIENMNRECRDFTDEVIEGVKKT